MKRALYAFMTLVFILFALLQWNDEGAWPWILGYGWAALLFAMKLFPSIQPPAGYYRGLLIASTALYLIWALFWLPGVVEWIDLGMPSVTASMSAESPYIEVVREFGGLLICTVAVAFLAATSPHNTKRSDK